jgi:circadian clock protein KaiB
MQGSSTNPDGTATEEADITEAFEQAISSSADGFYVLRLYVTGSTPRSLRAIMNLKRMCEEQLAGRYDLEVIDLYQQPQLAAGADLIAAPTLIKQLPLPVQRFVGDLANLEHRLVGWSLSPRATDEGSP